MMNKVFQWFLTTWAGEYYFRFLLWRDRSSDKSVRYLTPSEAVTITRQYSLLHRGVEEVKREVNKLINAKSAQEYDAVLKGIEDMMNLAQRDENSSEARLADVLRSFKVKKGSKDIVTHTDHAKMIQGRMEDYRELQSHVERRSLMRQIRKAKQAGNQEQVSQLEKQWKEKYGR